MGDNMKIVSFEVCQKCIHWEQDEFDDPCHECLHNSTNYASQKPLYFEENPERKKKNA